MGKTFDIAVVGAASAEGEDLLKLLAERKFPFGRVYVLGSPAGEFVDFGEDGLQVEDLAAFDFSTAQLAFFVAGAEISAAYAAKAGAAGCIVIDSSPQFRGDEEIPLVVADVNPQALADSRRRCIVATPGSAVTQLAIVLAPLHRALGIERVNVATYRPVSAAGKSAIEELAQQSARALNGMAQDGTGQRKQVAFNVLPQVGAFLDNGYTAEEMSLVWETRKVLSDGALAVNAAAAQVPVFFGQSMAVNIETRKKATPDVVRRLLAQAPGVKVTDPRKPGDYPTAVEESVASDAVFVGRIREDLSHPRGLNLWIVADNVRKAGALNSLQIAELLVESYLQDEDPV